MNAVLDSPLFVAAAILACVWAAESLCSWPMLRQLGSALLAILLGAIAANMGVIPSFASHPVYGVVFTYLAPLSIFWLLLAVDLRSVLRAGRGMLLAFAVGAAGTLAGVLAGYFLVGGRAAFGNLAAPLAGMFAGTYIGGSLNFNALALEYGIATRGVLYASAVAVDNILTALWMIACLVVPRWLGASPSASLIASPMAKDERTESLGPTSVARMLALGLLALLLRDLVSAELARWGWSVPKMLVLSVLGLGAGQLSFIQRLPGASTLGLFSVQVFLTVIGALCSLEALRTMGQTGLSIALLATTTVVVHGLVAFGAMRWLRVDPATASVASQANIGGGTTALALARSLGRGDLVVPAILVGALGTAVGNFVGFGVVALLGR